ncbi:hypothetical protein QUN95_000534 [Vibrio parahaemolyticus]|nr:hypothetical protein [Vibrio parahaemolyticus]EHK9072489.1 hypothetical protein [Vibrio parahaemolyticus]EIU6789977.1 hypothetical protein [Vibrio parahaemolyticus]EIY6179347.1 hypothetical protein [Vibrio parahaemolyticus]EIZ1174575.1 hypothetical protein [Vibrio parahaemolyticus]
MQVNPKIEFMREPSLNYSDRLFFGGFGFVLSFLLLLFSQFKLPSQMDRGILTSLLFDHIPFNTISILLLSMVLILTISVALGKVKGSSKKLLNHLSNRISQFCSPAFFILMGNSVALTVFFLFSQNLGYLGYALAFSMFALLLVLISKLSSELVDSVDTVHARLPTHWAISLCVILIFLPLVLAFFDSRPKSIEISVDVEQFDVIKELANRENVSVEEYARRVLLQK